MPVYQTITRLPGYRFGDDGSIESRWRIGGGGGLGDEWKPIKGHQFMADGRRMTVLRTEHGVRRYQVHRLILEAFRGPCPEGMECRHLNGNAADNRLENLAWGTREENMRDRDAHGTTPRGEKAGKAKLTRDDVIAIRARRAAGEHYKAIAQSYGVDTMSVFNIVKRKNWKHV